MALSRIQSKKALYKKALAALLAGTMGMGIAGCSNSNNEEKPKEDVTKEEQPESPTKDSQYTMPTEVMSEEETKALVEGTMLSLEEPIKMPDEAVLEEMNLMPAYYVSSTFYDENNQQTSKEIKLFQGVLPETIDENGFATRQVSTGSTEHIQLLGIKIVPIAEIKNEADGSYTKGFLDPDLGAIVYGGPVLSQTLKDELNGVQKVYQ